MKDININNYEAYLLDYSEGLLSPREVAELMLFISENPNLAGDLPDGELPSLINIETESYSDKDALKSIADLPDLNKETAELYLIAEIENQLNQEQREILRSFLKTYPEVNKSRDLYQRSVFEPDKRVTFPSKKQLYRGRIFTMRNLYQASAIAASLLLFLYIGLSTNSEDKNINAMAAGKSASITKQRQFAYHSEIDLTHPLIIGKPIEVIAKPEVKLTAKKAIIPKTESPVENLAINKKVEAVEKSLVVDKAAEVVMATADQDSVSSKAIEVPKQKEQHALEMAQANSRSKTGPMKVDQFLKKVLKKQLSKSKQEKDAADSYDNENLALEIAEDIVPNFDVKKNDEGEVFAYSFRIGSFGISRKSGKN